MVPLSGNTSPDGRLTVPLTESPLTANVSVGLPPPLGSTTVAFQVPAIDFDCAADFDCGADFDCAATGFAASSTAATNSNDDFTTASWYWYEGWTRYRRSRIPR